MLPSQSRDEYIRALYALSKRDPHAWATFVEAFKVYTADEMERITTASIEAAPRAIGSGRRMKELRDDFIGIDGIMHSIANKK